VLLRGLWVGNMGRTGRVDWSVCSVAVVVWDDDVRLCVLKQDWISRFNYLIRVASFFPQP
jgi:hypothetical protein